MLSKVEYFSIKSTKGKTIKIFSPKQILQTLPIPLAQVKASNASGNLLYIICIEQNKLPIKYTTTI